LIPVLSCCPVPWTQQTSPVPFLTPKVPIAGAGSQPLQGSTFLLQSCSPIPLFCTSVRPGLVWPPLLQSNPGFFPGFPGQFFPFCSRVPPRLNGNPAQIFELKFFSSFCPPPYIRCFFHSPNKGCVLPSSWVLFLRAPSQPDCCLSSPTPPFFFSRTTFTFFLRFPPFQSCGAYFYTLFFYVRWPSPVVWFFFFPP